MGHIVSHHRKREIEAEHASRRDLSSLVHRDWLIRENVINQIWRRLGPINWVCSSYLITEKVNLMAKLPRYFLDAHGLLPQRWSGVRSKN